MTKEDHCSKIITRVADYCLCQRVKPAIFKSDEEYVQALKAHHAVMQAGKSKREIIEQVERSCSTYIRTVVLELTLSLRFVVVAMKCKQVMDTASCDALDHAISDMAKMYTPV